MNTPTRTKEWERVKLGEVCEETENYDPTKKPHKPFTYIDVSSVSSKSLAIENPAVLLGKDAPSRARKLVRKGDTIFATVRPTLRRVAKVPETLDGQVASTGYCVVRADQYKADADFIYFTLCTTEVMDYVRSIERGVSYPAISDKDLLRFSLELPPLPEQKDIARVLTTVQAAIAEQERLIEKLKELKRSMMSHLFTHGIKGEKTKMTEIGEIPESWEVVELGNLCEVKGGKRLPKGDKLTSTNTGLPYIRVTDLLENSVDLSNIQYLHPETQKAITRYTITTKDIYISIAGSIGFMGIIPDEIEGANLTENAAKLCLRTDDVQQKFLMYWLSADQVQRDIKSQTVKNAQPKLALARIQKLSCVLPKADEQEQIVRALDSIGTAVSVTATKIDVYRSLFKTLLHELMSGERRVKNI